MLAEAAYPHGTATGVDASRDRLAACRTVATKYAHTNIRLYLADGTSFAAPPPIARATCGLSKAGVADRTTVGDSGDEPVAKRAAPVRRRRRHDRRQARKDAFHQVGAMFYAAPALQATWMEANTPPPRLVTAAEAAATPANTSSAVSMGSSGPDRSAVAVGSSVAAGSAVGDRSSVAGGSSDPDSSSVQPTVGLSPSGSQPASAATACLYDRVLVDAECTHDGSLKHMAKHAARGWDVLPERMLNAERLEALGRLQRALLLNGFNLLRPGGRLVYSTCSLTTAQNEDVVRWFLGTAPNARLVPAGLMAAAPAVAVDAARYPDLPYALRVRWLVVVILDIVGDHFTFRCLCFSFSVSDSALCLPVFVSFFVSVGSSLFLALFVFRSFPVFLLSLFSCHSPCLFMLSSPLSFSLTSTSLSLYVGTDSKKTREMLEQKPLEFSDCYP